MDIRQAATGGRSSEVGTREGSERSCRITRPPSHNQHRGLAPWVNLPCSARLTLPSASFSSQQSPLSLARSFGPFQSFSIADNTSRKRKSYDDVAIPSKRSSFNNQRSKLAQEYKGIEGLENARTTGRKSVGNETEFIKKPTRRSQRLKPPQGHEVSQGSENAHSAKGKPEDSEERSSKRSRSKSQKSKSNQEYEAQQVIQTTSLYYSNDGSFENRLFCCLAISPAGRAISRFELIPELLTTLRDAIKAHRSLYIQGNILHRDISENNIIITDPKKTDGFTGMLIDLDLAKVVGSGRSGARHQTGTMEFMAIEVLERAAHTYRHDLESFFYVLLWMCARRVWEREFQCKAINRPTASMLMDWYTDSFEKIAQRKEYAMGVNGFKKLLNEFPQALDYIKPLCKKIRGILFPLLKDGALSTGTSSDPPEELYHRIIEAFDSAIADIAAG